MDYNQKYKELTEGILKCVNPLPKEYDNLSGFEKCVLVLRFNNYTYNQIQLKLGMPSKKDIRQALLNTKPELIDNSKKKIIYYRTEDRISGILKANNQWEFDLDEFGLSTFKEEDGDLYFIDEWNDVSKVSDLDERTKKSILLNIIEILHLNIEI